MEFYHWYGLRLFRRDPKTERNERWDAEESSWIDVDTFVFEEAVFDPDPRFPQVTEEQARELYPKAFEDTETDV